MKKFIFLIFLFFFSGGILSSNTERSHIPVVSIPYLSSTPTIDGKLNDTCWKSTIEIFPFISMNGKTLPSQQTKVWAVYDKSSIYIAFECLDMHLDPALNQLDALKMLRTERDTDIWEDDSVEIFISPYEEGIPYYHFVINPLGTVYDAYCPTAQDRRKDWNGEVKIKTSVGERSWVAEISLPLKNFTGDSSVTGKEWRINFNRNKQALKEFSCWSPTLTGFHNPDRFGKLLFAEKVIPVRLQSFPFSFAKGENILSIKVMPATAEEIEIETIVEYGGADKVSERSYFQIKGSTENVLKKPYIIYPDTGERVKSKEIFLSYKISSHSKDMIYYLSPQFVHHREVKDTPFYTRLMSCTFGAYFTHFKEIYIAQNSVQYLLVIIQSDFREKIDNVRFVLEVPAFLTLVNPVSPERKAPQPLKVDMEEIRKDGIKYRKYILTYPKNQIYSTGDLPTGKHHNTILLEAGEIMDAPEKIFIYFYTEADMGGNIIKEDENKIPLHILPPLKRKSPKEVIIMEASSPATGLILELSQEEKNKIYRTWHNAGFNAKLLNEFGKEVFPEDDVRQFQNLGMKPIQGLPTNTKSSQWEKRHFPDAMEFLREYPQYRAKTAEGKDSDEVICISHLLNKDGIYRIRMENWLSKLAKRFPFILWDLESPPASPSSTCFCEVCLKNFKNFAGIKEQLSPKKVISDYKKQWIDFQCWRQAELVRVLREIIKKANPSAKIIVYSGYQSERTRESYSVDWDYFSKYIDIASCGYGRPVSEIANTLLALKGKPLVSGELIWTFRDVLYPMENLRVNLFRRITDAGGGILTYNDLSVDGRFYRTINDIASITADYEEFFINFNRNDKAVTVEGLSGENIAVLTNKKGELLIFLFNETSKEKECFLINPVKNTSMTVIDCFNNTPLSRDNRINITIPPKDVKVIFVGNKKTPEVSDRVKQPPAILSWYCFWASPQYYDVPYAISRGSVQPVWLRLWNPTDKPLSAYRAIIEMPSYLSLVDYTGRPPYGENMNLPTCRKEEVKRDGKIFHRYYMDFPEPCPPYPADKGMDYYKATKVFLLSCAKDAPEGKEGEIKVWFESEGKRVGTEKTTSVEVLPPLKGKKSSKIFQMVIGDFYRFSKEEWENLFQKTFVPAGITEIQLTVQGHPEFDSARFERMKSSARIVIESAKRAGLDVVLEIEEYFGQPLFPVEKDFKQAIDVDGKPVCLPYPHWTKNEFPVSCPTWFLEEGYETVQNTVIQYMKEFGAEHFWRSVEVGPKAGTYCFCDRCLEEFRKYAGLSKTPERKEVLELYKEKWLDFRRWQFGQMSGKFLEAVKTISPSGRYYVYSGLSGEISLNRYLTDWKYYRNNCSMGIAGVLGSYEETIKALYPTPLMGRTGTYAFNPLKVSEQIKYDFRQSGGKGLRIFYVATSCGRVYQTIAELTGE